MTPGTDNTNHVVLGHISGLYGVRGWLKVYSHCRPRENIFSYNPWLIERSTGSWNAFRVVDWKSQGKGLVARFDGIEDRSAAQLLVGKSIAIERVKLPELGQDEYYWCDLIGLDVINQRQEALGKVVEILETGANDVLVVQGRKKILIPLLKGSVVMNVDQEHGSMEVDWEDEYI